MRYSAIILSLLISTVANAQIQMETTIGYAASYVSTKNTNSKNIAIFRPNANVLMTIPVFSNVAVRTGVHYSMRGYNTDQTEYFDVDYSSYMTKIRMHYLSIPLLASFKVYQYKHMQFWIDGGIQYNFFLAGNLRIDYESYIDNKLVVDKGELRSIKGWFTPSKFSPSRTSYDVNGMDVAVKLQLRLVMDNRFSLSIFHESSLYDLRSNPDNAASSVKMQYSGVNIGYRLF